MNKIVKYVVADLLRSRAIMVYAIILLVLSVSVFSIEDNADKGVVSLLNIILFVVPLVSIIFSTVYLYNSAEFIELLVSQPLRRRTIWMNIFAGLASTLALAFLIGVGVPIAIYAFTPSAIVLLLSGVVLSVVFVSIAMWAAVRIRDKAKGIGLSILLWLYFALLFDAIVLFLLFQFSDYPIENAMVAVSMLNPIDISRILILLQVDVSAMMGYTGAIFRHFFGTGWGMAVTGLVLMLWMTIPVWFSLQFFKRRDL